MDLHCTPAQERFRAETRLWLEAHVPGGVGPDCGPRLLSLDTAGGFAAHRAWEHRMFDARWSVVSWPEEFGGRGASLAEWLIFEEEYYRVRAPVRVGQNGIFLLAPTMFEFGTPAQQARFLPKMASGVEVWCQGWSEPDAGSDLAGIRSRAERRPDGEWVLNGQKTWCSRGAFADWLFGLFRSDPAAERHRGLTYFLVDLATPGVTVRPIAQLDGETGFAEVFFEDVVVPAHHVLGAVDQGWNVAMATASSERGLSLRSPARYTEAAGRLVDLLVERTTGPAPRSTPHDAALAEDAVARAWMAAEAYRLHTWWTATRLAAGGAVGPEASIGKIHWSETDLAIQRAALDLMGEEAWALGPDGRPGDWLDGYLFALAGPIYAGTNEIQRNVVAERILGLPRELTVQFAFSDQQLSFRDQLRSFYERECTPAHVRAEWDSATGWSRARWSALADMGVVGLTVPEADHGLGLGLADLVLLLEEAGRAAAPEPLVETVALGTYALGSMKDPARRQALLEGAARGAVVLGVGRIDRGLSIDVAGADVYIFGRRDRGPVGSRSGPVVVAVPVADLEVIPGRSIDGAHHPSSCVIAADAGDVVASGAGADDLLDQMADRASVAAAAYLLGVTDALLAKAADYAKDRRQFGRPVGSFQAVKHHLANVLVALEMARPSVYRAAWSIDAGQATVRRDASMAKAMASEAALTAARVALQVHGAIGYTWECDLHFWMKRAWVMAARFGDADHHRRQVLGAVVAARQAMGEEGALSR